MHGKIRSPKLISFVNIQQNLKELTMNGDLCLKDWLSISRSNLAHFTAQFHWYYPKDFVLFLRFPNLTKSDLMQKVKDH